MEWNVNPTSKIKQECPIIGSNTQATGRPIKKLLAEYSKKLEDVKGIPGKLIQFPLQQEFTKPQTFHYRNCQRNSGSERLKVTMGRTDNNQKSILETGTRPIFKKRNSNTFINISTRSNGTIRVFILPRGLLRILLALYYTKKVLKQLHGVKFP